MRKMENRQKKMAMSSQVSERNFFEVSIWLCWLCLQTKKIREEIQVKKDESMLTNKSRVQEIKSQALHSREKIKSMSMKK